MRRGSVTTKRVKIPRHGSTSLHYKESFEVEHFKECEFLKNKIKSEIKSGTYQQKLKTGKIKLGPLMKREHRDFYEITRGVSIL